MKKLLDFLLSMPLMAFLLLFMAVASGTATFIESNFGPVAARAAVYNTWWFELIMVLLVISITGNMIVKKTYKKKKLTIFLFHISFVLIFLGAAVTRYISYEGTMHIREGEASSEILTADNYISLTVSNGEQSREVHKKVLFTPGEKNRFFQRVQLKRDDVAVELEEFLPSAQKQLIPVPEGEPILALFIMDRHTRKNYFLRHGDTLRLSDMLIGFNSDRGDIIFSDTSGQLQVISAYPLSNTDMSLSTTDSIPAGTPANVVMRNVYAAGFLQIVPAEYNRSARIIYSKGNPQSQNFWDVLNLKVSSSDRTETVFVRGHANVRGIPEEVQLGNLSLTIEYGPRVIRTPFELFLNDFQIERYPGSNSPSSYASEVTVKDPEKGVEMPFRIYMNHILNYGGFRFFQSSYDQDEQGTILSVNHDALGTTLTYLGYFLMMLTMILSIFNKNSRFMKLGRSIDLDGAPKKIAGIVLLAGLFLFTGGREVSGQNITNPSQVVTPEAARIFAPVLVQDQGGRIKPFETLASEIVRKVAYKSSIQGIKSTRVVMSMYFYPSEWQRVPMIRVSDEQIRYMLGIHSNFASFIDFFEPGNNSAYKLRSAIQNAYQKDPSRRSKIEQDIIKIDERVNICYLVYTGGLFRIFPVAGDPNHRWYSPKDASEHVHGEDSLFVTKSIDLLFTYLQKGAPESQVSELVNGIREYQRTRAEEIVPSETKVRMEIFYNKAGIFEKLSIVYGLMGFILLVLLFFHILIPKLKVRGFTRLTMYLLGLGFIFHTLGLALRWYISGHAPWSNGYESMIYIGWAMVLAGVIFARKSPFALAAGGILSALTLFVAHLSWMSPEITNLVPVLKSYWLSIHVSVITASYGFLGMGMVLGLFNLVLIIFKNEKNKVQISQTVTTLTRINEMTLILGVYFISIGTFLGGVWANESWGRYWGWDPKETWALITMMVYIVIVHMRLIPGMRGEFAFNLASILGFSSVLMTYFGVNYYLSGLHSYAQGEASSIPIGVWFGLAILGLIVLLSWLNERKFSQPPVEDSPEPGK